MTRIVRFVESSVAVGYDSPDAGRVVDLLYRDVAHGDGAEPRTELTIRRDRESGRFSLSRGSARLYEGDSLGVLATILMGATIHDLVDDCHHGMALHAAALSRHGAGLLLPGRSGAGKSSLAMWLACRGFNYLTDEVVWLREQTDVLECFTRPICIKPATLAALRAELDLERHQESVINGGYVTMVPHRLLNPTHRRESPTLQVIVFPDYRAGAEAASLEPLSKAHAGLGLMECLVNARNLDGHGLAEAVRIARRIPAYRLTYGRFDQLEAVFGGTLRWLAPDGWDDA